MLQTLWLHRPSAEPVPTSGPEPASGLPPFSPDLLPTASPEAAAKFAAQAREHGLDFSDEDGEAALTRLMRLAYLLMQSGPVAEETGIRADEEPARRAPKRKRPRRPRAAAKE